MSAFGEAHPLRGLPLSQFLTAFPISSFSQSFEKDRLDENEGSKKKARPERLKIFKNFLRVSIFCSINTMPDESGNYEYLIRR